ncbi:MAG: hypothetical protein ABJN36_08495 [Cyclobacteriaceae bacterium]
MTNYFRTAENEPRLIDIIGLFYLIMVLLYTSSDLRNNTPTGLTIAGIIFHGTTLFMWFDHLKKKSRIKPAIARQVLYFITPAGLVMVYTLTLRYELLNYELTDTLKAALALYGLTFIPMITYLLAVAFNGRKPSKLPVLTMRHRLVNLTFVFLFGILQLTLKALE